jgi:LysM repeat protein
LGAATPIARSRFARRVPVAAAPALLGLAAAVVVANAHPGHPAGPSHPAAATAAGSTTAELLAVTRPAGPAGQPAKPARYTVKAGDTLSGIARRLYHSDRYWPVLYWANHRQVRDASEIRAGQVLSVPARPAKIPAPPSDLGSAPVPAAASTAGATYAPSSFSGYSAGGYSQPQSTAAVTGSTVSASGGGSFQACVIARESGGNSQVTNGSGHYGLYQFSASTWSAYGGSAADFGNASVAEQNQVFSNAIAAGGQSNWAPYDGC